MCYCLGGCLSDYWLCNAGKGGGSALGKTTKAALQICALAWFDGAVSEKGKVHMKHLDKFVNHVFFQQSSKKDAKPKSSQHYVGLKWRAGVVDKLARARGLSVRELCYKGLLVCALLLSQSFAPAVSCIALFVLLQVLLFVLFVELLRV